MASDIFLHTATLLILTFATGTESQFGTQSIAYHAQSIPRGYQPPPQPVLIDPYEAVGPAPPRPQFGNFQPVPSNPNLIPRPRLPPSIAPPDGFALPPQSTAVGLPPHLATSREHPVVINTLIQVFANGVNRSLGKPQLQSQVARQHTENSRVVVTKDFDTQEMTFVNATDRPGEFLNPRNLVTITGTATTESKIARDELEEELEKELANSIPLILEELEKIKVSMDLSGAKHEPQNPEDDVTVEDLEKLIQEGLDELDDSEAKKQLEKEFKEIVLAPTPDTTSPKPVNERPTDTTPIVIKTEVPKTVTRLRTTSPPTAPSTAPTTTPPATAPVSKLTSTTVITQTPAGSSTTHQLSTSLSTDNRPSPSWHEPSKTPAPETSSTGRTTSNRPEVSKTSLSESMRHPPTTPEHFSQETPSATKLPTPVWGTTVSPTAATATTNLQPKETSEVSLASRVTSKVTGSMTTVAAAGIDESNENTKLPFTTIHTVVPTAPADTKGISPGSQWTTAGGGRGSGVTKPVTAPAEDSFPRTETPTPEIASTSESFSKQSGPATTWMTKSTALTETEGTLPGSQGPTASRGPGVTKPVTSPAEDSYSSYEPVSPEVGPTSETLPKHVPVWTEQPAPVTVKEVLPALQKYETNNETSATYPTSDDYTKASKVFEGNEDLYSTPEVGDESFSTFPTRPASQPTAATKSSETSESKIILPTVALSTKKETLSPSTTTPATVSLEKTASSTSVSPPVTTESVMWGIPEEEKCEVPNDETDTIKGDVLFLLDGSAAVGEQQFKRALKLVKQTVLNFNNIGPTGIQVALVQFNQEPVLEFSLRRHTCLSALLTDIENTKFMSGPANVDRAVEKVFKFAFTQARGDRSEAPNVLVLITDGIAENDKLQHPLTFGDKNGTTPIVVATIEAKRDLLAGLVADNHKNVFNLTDIIHRPLGERLASRIKGILSNEDNNPDNGNALAKEPLHPVLLPSAKPSGPISLDKKDVHVECGKHGVDIWLNVEPEYRGTLFVKGFESEADCRHTIGGSSLIESKSVTISAGKCGLSPQSSEHGLSYSFVINLVHNQEVVTAHDRSFIIECSHPSHPANTTVKTELEIVGETPLSKAIELKVAPPPCRYTLRRDTPNGPLVTHAKIGQIIYHRWECDTNDEVKTAYGFYVHNCSAANSTEREFFYVDANGCSTDPQLVNEIVYADEKLLAFARSFVFSLVDVSNLLFSCKISFCVRDGDGCEGYTPPACQHTNTSNLLLTRRVRHYDEALQAALTSQVSADPLVVSDPRDAMKMQQSHVPVAGLLASGAVVLVVLGALGWFYYSRKEPKNSPSVYTFPDDESTTDKSETLSFRSLDFALSDDNAHSLNEVVTSLPQTPELSHGRC